jgi:hypothetical protein
MAYLMLASLAASAKIATTRDTDQPLIRKEFVLSRVMTLWMNSRCFSLLSFMVSAWFRWRLFRGIVWHRDGFCASRLLRGMRPGDGCEPRCFEKGGADVRMMLALGHLLPLLARYRLLLLLSAASGMVSTLWRARGWLAEGQDFLEGAFRCLSVCFRRGNLRCPDDI